MGAGTMKRKTFFNPMTDRYAFDFDLCSHRKGWAQVDTGQDASYFGTWAHPHKRQIVTYAEGDITVTTAENDEEFVAGLRMIRDWNEESGHGFKGIDGMCDDKIIAEFNRLGLGELLH
jgi:hypothetical protein